MCIIDNQRANVAIKKLHRAYTEDQPKMRELEKEWQKEVQAHKEIAKCNHSNIIKFMTAITRDYERYLMFEWANGGNLREFWAEYSPRLTKSLVKDILLQLRGLADALEEIHSKGFRHGDMKPENVLRIKTPGNDSAIGTLKICDMGLTKYHYLATQLRQQATDTSVFHHLFLTFYSCDHLESIMAVGRFDLVSCILPSCLC
jgi:serine/threonine protein kinase